MDREQRRPPGPDGRPLREAKRQRIGDDKKSDGSSGGETGGSRESSGVESSAAARELRLQCVFQSRTARRAALAGCATEAYREMADDALRMRSYRHAIDASVRGQRVLELGPGPLCPLTLMCLDAGAKEVVAVECCTWAATAARELLAPHPHVTVIEADAAALRPDDLPTAASGGGGGHFDVLVQELYGTVAGAEDAVEIVAGEWT
jgi:hypothetical protein